MILTKFQRTGYHQLGYTHGAIGDCSFKFNSGFVNLIFAILSETKCCANAIDSNSNSEHAITSLYPKLDLNTLHVNCDEALRNDTDYFPFIRIFYR